MPLRYKIAQGNKFKKKKKEKTHRFSAVPGIKYFWKGLDDAAGVGTGVPAAFPPSPSPEDWAARAPLPHCFGTYPPPHPKATSVRAESPPQAGLSTPPDFLHPDTAPRARCGEHPVPDVFPGSKSKAEGACAP